MPILINIKGLDKRQLLLELYKNAKWATIFEIDGAPNKPEFDEDQLDMALQWKGADYLCGKPIKIDFRKDLVDFEDYNFYNGENLANKIIFKMKLNKKKLK